MKERREDSMPVVIYYKEIESPIGTLMLSMTGQGLCRLDFGTRAEQDRSLDQWVDKHFPRARWERSDDSLLLEAEKQLTEYFAGTRQTFDLPLDLRGTPFQREVWEALRHIPYGATWSYKQVGEAIGRPKAVRAIGYANHCNPLSVIVPCHRVIGADGSLVGYGGGLDIKRTLLALEAQAAVS